MDIGVIFKLSYSDIHFLQIFFNTLDFFSQYFHRLDCFLQSMLGFLVQFFCDRISCRFACWSNWSLLHHIGIGWSVAGIGSSDYLGWFGWDWGSCWFEPLVQLPKF